MDEKAISNLRSRIEQCRRLAADTTDDRARKILRDMANEGEADLARVLAEQDTQPIPGERGLPTYDGGEQQGGARH